MRNIIIILALAVLSACTSIPNAHITTRPERVVLTKPAQAYFDPGPVRSAAVFDIPAGVYSMVYENAKCVYYQIQGAEIKKTWTKFHGGSEPPRTRPGGLLLRKREGQWSVFMLGPSSDFSYDGVGGVAVLGIGLLASDKIDGKYVEFCACIGRVDENGKLVHLEGSNGWGYIDDLTSVKFEGNVPFSEK